MAVSVARPAASVVARAERSATSRVDAVAGCAVATAIALPVGLLALPGLSTLAVLATSGAVVLVSVLAVLVLDTRRRLRREVSNAHLVMIALPPLVLASVLGWVPTIVALALV